MVFYVYKKLRSSMAVWRRDGDHTDKIRPGMRELGMWV